MTTTDTDALGLGAVSRLQNRLWFFSRLYPELPFFAVPIALELSGPVAAEGVRAVLGELLARHDALRTCLVATAAASPRPVLIDPEVHLRVEDLRAEPDPDAAWDRLLDQASNTPLDLERGPLLRALLADLGAGRHRLCLSVHHATVDGVSVEVLLREFATAYGAWEQGELADALGEKPATYAEFAQWHEQAAASPAYAKAQDYWRRKFADLRGPSSAPDSALAGLTTDRPRKADRTFQVRVTSVPLPSDLSTRLREFSREHRVTPFFVMTAALATLLRGRDGGRGDVVLATPWTLRRDRWLNGTVGLFANTIPLRVRMVGDPVFDDVVAAARSAVFEAMDACLVPYDEIVALAEPVRDPGTPPLAAVGFQVLDEAAREFEAGSVRMRRLPTRDGAGDFDLVWELITAADGSCSLAATYTADIFDEATVTGLSAELLRVLDESLADPASPISARAVAVAVPPRSSASQDFGSAVVSALDSHEAVLESALVRHPVGGRPETIAFVAVSDVEAVTPATLRALVAEYVPEGAVPTWFVLLDELPRDAAGAVDTVELAAIAVEVVGVDADGDPDVEAGVREVWEEHLETTVPTLDTTFFDLRGHSLIAVRIAAALQRRFGRPVPVRAIFEHPTVRTLAGYLVASAPERPVSEPVLIDGSRLVDDLDEASEAELSALAALIGGGTEAVV